MKTYIRKSIKGYYIEFPEEIDSQYWEGKIGLTYQDFLDDKWILLSDEQLAFHEQNPNANIKEVLDMQIVSPTPADALEDAKTEMLRLIEEYDNSEHINSFVVHVTPDTQGENGQQINGITIVTWIDPTQRSNYKNSLDSAELLGLEEVHPVFNGTPLTISTQMAKMALAQIQIYADRCYNVTETHKTNIKELNTVEAIENYDYMSGYPERPVFYLYDNNEEPQE